MSLLDRLPIRAKIAAACASLTAAAVLVFSIGTLVNLYHEQIEAVDLELTEEVRHVAHWVAAAEPDLDAIKLELVDVVEPWVAFAVVGSDGGVWRSRDALPEEVVRAVPSDGTTRTIRHARGSWRAESVRFADGHVVAAVNLEEVHDIVTDLLFAYVLALPLAGIVAGVGGWFVAGRSLQPVRQLTATAAAIHVRNLSARVPVPPARDELAHLARMLNAMLLRLEKSFEQAERFAADASHELLTPLTIMRGELEALLREAEFPQGVEQRLVSLQEEVHRLERITGNLLLLAKLDTGAALATSLDVDFSRLVADACDDIEPLMVARSVTFEAELAPGQVVAGDDALLRRVVLNLLENAVKFNEPGGCVRVRLEAERRGPVLSIENTGPGIPAAQRGRIFERFFRVDTARVRAGHGLGLGLAREIARVHGGDVVLDESAPETWTRFIVRLPNRSSTSRGPAAPR